MHGHKSSEEKIYPLYKPYPLSFGSEGNAYSLGDRDAPEGAPFYQAKDGVLEDFRDLIGDPTPAEFSAEPIPSNDNRSFRPLYLLQSLFAYRLDFLRRTLEELESAKPGATSSG
jgi:hypothetical protein